MLLLAYFLRFHRLLYTTVLSVQTVTMLTIVRVVRLFIRKTMVTTTNDIPYDIKGQLSLPSLRVR